MFSMSLILTDVNSSESQPAKPAVIILMLQLLWIIAVVQVFSVFLMADWPPCMEKKNAQSKTLTCRAILHTGKYHILAWGRNPAVF